MPFSNQLEFPLKAALTVWELIAILAVVAILFLMRKPDERPSLSRLRVRRDDFMLWIAQGFGAGRAPVAPGTMGSVVGLFWFLLLVATGSITLFVAGALAGVAVSVRVCGEGETILRQEDPGSIVFDEICAVPLCFASWLGIVWMELHAWPAPEYFFSARNWPLLLGVFTAFRMFDVLKPWPVRQSQRLPGGWGVTMDDVLAAAYVNILVLMVYTAWSAFGARM